ncbi:AbrB/MazE/SpoVT family DNA-binding domain-containing protein [Geobacter pelophilus]|uniref:AbrB/MazE/SpoVT family DNA-binding domain-containing protein n=1 Tax=Geoanaerobacter pelophilus TaxID=60036 RepID=A0AAW4L543_9BACT|nr:AbrB/MazE/SpoVT family DNA-binding domain-containing protein [Geoanaerobacter pelophilus]MBT0664677.1 AbrB/MazE/SpoVT family DNA-binding domain-containing protein [Geoanaerobacter pelophilus]
MRTSIIRIGNSQGIRIPKVLLQQSHLGTEVELDVEDEKIIIRSASHPRQGWGEKFKLMAESSDDKIIDDDLSVQTEWEKEEWQW